jgi:hypothetical protein
MTHLRKIMLEELERRNYAQATIDCYLRAVTEFSFHFHRPPYQGIPHLWFGAVPIGIYRFSGPIAKMQVCDG